MTRQGMPWDINLEWQLCGWEFLFPTEEELFAYMVHMVNVSRSCLFSEFPLSRAWVSASPVVLPSCPDLTRPPFFILVIPVSACYRVVVRVHSSTISHIYYPFGNPRENCLFKSPVHFSICVCMCVRMYLHACVNVWMHLALFTCRGQRTIFLELLLFLYLSMWVLNSCHQACTASAFTCWATLLGPS